jgi:hypothetical protein
MDYGLADIDEYGCVKPGMGTLLVTFFLSRQILFIPLILISKRQGRASSGAKVDMSFLQVFSAWEFVACIPALMVLVAIFMRKPTAGSNIRWVWKNARNLLLFGAVAQIAIYGSEIVYHHLNNSFLLVSLGLCLYVCFYIFTSKRLADSIRQFPEKA